MQEKELSNEESLKLINRMIHEAKGYFFESGTSGLIYGFSAAVCSVLAYLDDKGVINFPFSPFYLMVPIFFLQAFVEIKESKKKKAKTFTDEAIDWVWTGFFLSVFVAVSGAFANAGYIVVTIIIFLAGLATFITGAISKFKYSIICGVMCLIVAAISFFIQNSTIYLLLAGVAIFVWGIPGIMLKILFKRQNHG